jgi:hypothetical protein
LLLVMFQFDANSKVSFQAPRGHPGLVFLPGSPLSFRHRREIRPRPKTVFLPGFALQAALFLIIFE